MKLTLQKMHGCGNDFLILDYFGEDEPPQFRAFEVVNLCSRQFGVGADGFVVIAKAKSPDVDAAWTFYNCDGSEAEMCGNAARCVVKYISERHFAGADHVVSLETKSGVIRGKTLPDRNVEITMFSQGSLRFEYQERAITTDKNVFNIFSINTGVPHAVLEVKDLFHYPIDVVGKLLVKHPAFDPHGSNVTFFQRVVGSRIRSTTFERGVEKETFACGTGAVAAAIIFAEQYLQPFPIEVSVPGGELVVDLSPVSKMVLLRGPAHHVYEVEIETSTVMESIVDLPRLFGERKKSS